MIKSKGLSPQTLRLSFLDNLTNCNPRFSQLYRKVCDMLKESEKLSEQFQIYSFVPVMYTLYTLKEMKYLHCFYYLFFLSAFEISLDDFLNFCRQCSARERNCCMSCCAWGWHSTSILKTASEKPSATLQQKQRDWENHRRGRRSALCLKTRWQLALTALSSMSFFILCWLYLYLTFIPSEITIQTMKSWNG